MMTSPKGRRLWAGDELRTGLLGQFRYRGGSPEAFGHSRSAQHLSRDRCPFSRVDVARQANPFLKFDRADKFTPQRLTSIRLRVREALRPSVVTQRILVATLEVRALTGTCIRTHKKMVVAQATRGLKR